MLDCFRGWDGGIRTPECLDQNQVPYHLATSQYVLAVAYAKTLYQNNLRTVIIALSYEFSYVTYS